MSISHAAEVAYCRSFQAVLKLANYFMGYRMPVYVEGPGKIKELGAFLKEKNINDVLVVTGASMIRRGQVQPMLDSMEAEGVRYTIKAYEATDPTSDDVEDGYRAFAENKCKAIVALGGGSRIDCAKAIAAKAARPKKTVAQLQGLLQVHKPIVPFVAIPTTAGTGSETTVAAVITDSKTHRKASINDPFLIPKYAVLDSELTLGLPPKITATTGLDALAHAVEAYTNNTYNTALEKRLAREAVRLIHDNLYKAYLDGSDREARQNMQRAAFFAGRAFTRGCVGCVHALGHTLGGLYGVPHGLAMSVLLPHVLRQFGPAAHKRLSELAEVCGINGESRAEKAENFIRWVEELGESMDIPKGFDCIKNKDIEQMITWACKETNPLYPTPVVWGREDFRKLIDTVNLSPDKDKPEDALPAPRKSALYIYRPDENAMAFRVEHRTDAAYVYRGWSKGWVYKLAEDRIWAAGEEKASYIIIEDKICEAGSGKTLYKIAGDRIFRPGDREACFIIKKTITVQGTI